MSQKSIFSDLPKPKIDDWFVNDQIDATTLAARVKPSEDWLVGAWQVAQKTKDELALEIMKTVLNKPGVCMPDHEGMLCVLQGPEEPSIVMGPLLTEDIEVTEAARVILGEGSGRVAIFGEHQPGRIYFNARDEFSPMLRGLLLLHEALHAVIYEQSLEPEAIKMDYWIEEVTVFHFEFRLLAKLCGPDYDELIKRSVTVFAESYNDQDGTGGTLPAPSTIDISVLDSALGKSCCPYETTIRYSIVWMNVVFKMFERVYPETYETDQASFLKQIY